MSVLMALHCVLLPVLSDPKTEMSNRLEVSEDKLARLLIYTGASCFSDVLAFL